MDDVPLIEEKKRPAFLVWLLGGIVLVAVLFFFRGELKAIYLFARYDYLFAKEYLLTSQLPLDTVSFNPIKFIVSALVLYGCFFLILVILVSQVVLPVHTLKQRKQAFLRFLPYLFGAHGAALVVRDGQPIAKAEELRKTRAGVIFVDPSSAVVLERQAGGLLPGRKKPQVRVAGPGLVFIQPSEKIKGAVDLRKQIRMNKDVLGYTSDGIEVKTHIFAIFTLGQAPKLLQVAKLGNAAHDVRVVRLDEKTKQITGFSDELDPDDKAEIFNFMDSGWASLQPAAPLEADPVPPSYPPFVVDTERVFAAIYSRGLAMKNGDPSQDCWMDLPAQVATAIFRNLISQVTYDELYRPDEPGVFPLRDDLKPKFVRSVRNNGVLSYQVVQRRDGNLPEVGQFIDRMHFMVSPPQNLKSVKMLRKAGIKIIHAGFSELTPPLAVREQRVENWRARWQKETDLTRANQDLEVMRIRNQTRAQTQREMTYSLAQIFKSSEHSQEALAMRIFQALEAAATDPATHQLLPSDTIAMLRSLREWLLPEDTPLPDEYFDGDGMHLPFPGDLPR